jgi:hypothetical protein
MDATSHNSVGRNRVGDLQVADLDILHVVQPHRIFEPALSIRGFGPSPYRSMRIGAPGAPELRIASCPCHADPLLSRIRSPGWNWKVLILSSVFQGVLFEVLVLESEPVAKST